jgi:hypothetical protein
VSGLRTPLMLLLLALTLGGCLVRSPGLYLERDGRSRDGRDRDRHHDRDDRDDHDDRRSERR